VLSICQEYKVKDAIAFLYTKTGAVLQALDIYVEVFNHLSLNKDFH
jgi:hypothetical protein